MKRSARWTAGVAAGAALAAAAVATGGLVPGPVTIQADGRNPQVGRTFFVKMEVGF